MTEQKEGGTRTSGSFRDCSHGSFIEPLAFSGSIFPNRRLGDDRGSGVLVVGNSGVSHCSQGTGNPLAHNPKARALENIANIDGLQRN